MFELTPLTYVSGQDSNVLCADEQLNLVRSIWSLVYYRGYGDVSTTRMIDALGPFEFVTKEGKLAKRVSKWLKQQYQLVLKKHDLSELGSIISSFQPNTFWYDIVDRFDWDPGDFGDGGSCFWGGRSIAREYIRDAGGVAIRFFRENGNGCGRAWVVPYGEGWVLFNPYGPSMETVKGRIQQLYPDAKLKMVELENYNTTDGDVWINSGKGLYILPAANIDADYINHIDLELGEGDACSCDVCGERIGNDDDRYEVNGRRGHILIVCDNCVSEYPRCYHCDERYHEYYMNYPDILRRHGSWVAWEEYVCDNCVNHYSTCDKCEVWVDINDYSMVTVGYDSVCPRCIKNDYVKCEECDEYIKKGEACECHAVEEDVEEEQTTQAEMPVVPVEGYPRLFDYQDLQNFIQRVEEAGIA